MPGGRVGLVGGFRVVSGAERVHFWLKFWGGWVCPLLRYVTQPFLTQPEIETY